MTWVYQAKRLFLLVAISAVPALAQLGYDGFSPPVDIPFGISIKEVQELSGSVMWVDARPDEVYRASHVPGAINLNRTNWDQTLPQFFQAYSPGRTVIVYCSPDCSESQEIASRIRELGLDQILVLKGGFDAWKQANPHL